MATGSVMTAEEIQAKKDTETKTAEEIAAKAAAEGGEGKPAEEGEQTVTKTEAAAAGTTVDAVDAFFKSEMAEKYGIKDKDQLFGILESVNELRTERDQLKARPTEPVFKNDKEKNIYNFLQEYSNIGDGLEMVGRLGTIDPMNMDADKALQEAYILENKDLTRDQAIKMFNKVEMKKYLNPKTKEDYDDATEFEEENDILKIQKERAVNRARKILVDKKEEFKAKAQEKKPEEKDEPVIPQQSLKKYTGEVDKFFTNFNTLKFSEDDGSNEVSIKFTDAQLKELKQAAIAHVNNPTVYANGEIADFDIVNLVNTFAWAMNHRQMADLMLKQVKTIAHVTKAEEIAQKTPDKKSGTDTGEGTIDKSFWGQAEAAAKKKAADRIAQGGPGKRPPLPAG